MTPTKVMNDWFREVWNKGNVDHIDKHLAEECRVAGLGETVICCPAEFREFHAGLNAGFANMKCEIIRSFSSGEEIAGFVQVNAMHKQSGKPLEFHTSFIATIVDGKIKDCDNTVNFLDAFTQIGAVSDEVVAQTRSGPNRQLRSRSKS